MSPRDDATDYVDRGLRHLWVQTQQYADLAQPDGLKVFVGGDGVWVTDIRGRRFLDAMSGVWVVNVGHGRTELAEAAADQMRRLAYANTFEFASRPAIDLAERLASITPAGFERFGFVSSGSEAVETALRMAKHHQRNVGEHRRFKVIARRGGYHGVTAGALSVNGSTYIDRTPYEPLVPGTVFVENTPCRRCRNAGIAACGADCVDAVREVVEAERPETVAALIGEPISAANGGHLPSEAYWRAIREMCTELGILLIADEVITGFGRTGAWFASPGAGLDPDLITMAKGMGSGYVPIGGVGVSEHVARQFVGDRSRTFGLGTTFGSHPVSCAVALRNIEIIEAEDLVGNAERMGRHLVARLSAVADRHRIVGAVRGRGLLIALDVFRDPARRERFPASSGLSGALTAALADHGVLCRAGDTIHVAPPLVITRPECDELADRIDGALTDLERRTELMDAG